MGRMLKEKSQMQIGGTLSNSIERIDKTILVQSKCRVIIVDERTEL